MIAARGRAKEGLSPLARGNLQDAASHRDAVGPIPARAGEPELQVVNPYGQGAYPRSRGGTHCNGWRVAAHKGLSPLARGNHAHDTQSHFALRPIPARAGEPSAPRRL